MDVLLSAEYAAQRRKLIRSDQAWPEMPPAGDVSGFGAAKQKLPGAAQAEPAPLADTSYVCVVDRHGNAFSATPSDGSSATPVIPGTGLCPSSRGSQSWADPKHPAAVAPGKRPRLTPNPVLTLRNGKVFMPIGSPGNDIQPQAMLQVFLNVVVFRMDVQTAIEAPRFATYSYPSSFEPHNYFPGRLYLESRIAKTVGDELAGRGHKIHWWDDWTWLAGAVCTIVADRRHGVLHGGADPRRPAYVLGW